MARFPEHCWLNYCAVARFVIGPGYSDEREAHNFARGYAKWALENG